MHMQVYVCIHTNSHIQKNRRTCKAKMYPKVKPTLLLASSTVNTTEFSREISVIFTKSIFIF